MTDYTDALANVGGNDVTNTANAIPAGRTALNTGADTTTADFLARLRQGISSQETLPHMYTRIGNELNLPNLQASANTLNTASANLPYTYGSATRGFDVNSNQLGRIIGQKTYEMAPALTSANTALDTALKSRDTMVGAEQTQQAKELTPFTDEQSFLTDKYARESTGFTADNSTMLNALVSKMQSGVTLTTDEWDNLNKLAVAEKQYQATVAAANAKIYTSVPYTDSKILNTTTGKTTGWG